MSINGIEVIAFVITSIVLGYVSYKTERLVFLFATPTICLVGTIASIWINTYHWSLIPYTENARSAPDYIYGISDSSGLIVSFILVSLVSIIGYCLIKHRAKI